jgi:hypothetical protein
VSDKSINTKPCAHCRTEVPVDGLGSAARNRNGDIVCVSCYWVEEQKIARQKLQKLQTSVRPQPRLVINNTNFKPASH